jgi:hypothetical protein
MSSSVNNLELQMNTLIAKKELLIELIARGLIDLQREHSKLIIADPTTHEDEREIHVEAIDETGFHVDSALIFLQETDFVEQIAIRLHAIGEQHGATHPV